MKDFPIGTNLYSCQGKCGSCGEVVITVDTHINAYQLCPRCDMPAATHAVIVPANRIITGHAINELLILQDYMVRNWRGAPGNIKPPDFSSAQPSPQKSKRSPATEKRIEAARKNTEFLNEQKKKHSAARHQSSINRQQGPGARKN